MCITDKLFASECGREIYSGALSAISDFSMKPLIKGGTVLGFSGGADSVMLLLFLIKYRSEIGDFPIVAVHINHGIRGKEADEDEEFSRCLCQALNIPFVSRSYDVPKIAAERGIGLEEAARDLRYAAFREILHEKNYTSICVAHNATDNLETIILNMMRGSGTHGLSGISPVRDSILRPLIYSSKSLISSALTEAGISYKIDSSYIPPKVIMIHYNTISFQIAKNTGGTRRAGNIFKVLQSRICKMPRPELIKNTPPKIEISAISCGVM